MHNSSQDNGVGKVAYAPVSNASDNERAYLPISAVAEVLYCPRNFYYRVVEGAEDSNYHLLEGKLQEERRGLKERVVREESLQLRSIQVSLESLGLVGVVDALELKGEVYPVEYKKGSIKESVSDDAQVCAQAMALEETLGRDISKGYIYYAGSRARREVYFGGELRNLVEMAAYQARNIIESGEIPAPGDSKRCSGCSLASRCLPDEVKFLKGVGERPARPLPSVNPGRVLYVDRQGASIRKKSGRIVVSDGEEVVMDLPLCNIDQVVLVGGVNLTTPALKSLLDSGLGVAFLTSRGALRGSLTPALSKNSSLRIAQFRAYFSDAVRLSLARHFVRGKLVNMRTLIMRYNRELKDEGIASSVKRLAWCCSAAASAGDLPALLGIEGMGSREYFRAFGLLTGPGMTFDFTRRSRRPPRDPVNAMLGLGYSLLARDIKSVVEVVGFDPYVGFYHEAKYGRPALALDLMEEFRPVIADSVVLSMISRGIVSEEDFEYKLGGCFLNDSGRNKFYRAYEERKRQIITHPVFGYKLPYLRVFELQARFLGKVLQGDLPEYKPFITR